MAMPSRSILLIDYDANLREILHICLSDLANWHVVSVASLQEGLVSLLVNQPDVILMDFSISEIDGLSFIQRLKQNPLTRFIPVILIAAKANWLTTQQLKELNIDGAITKPFNPVTLPQQIGEMLGWSGDFFSPEKHLLESNPFSRNLLA